MEIKIKVASSFQFLNENGNSLNMQTGYELDENGKTHLPMYVRFVGNRIPFPIHSGTWFKGLCLSDTLKWFADHDWIVTAKADLLTGKVNGYQVNEQLYAAKEKRAETLYKERIALISAAKKAWSTGDKNGAYALYGIYKDKFGDFGSGFVFPEQMFDKMEMVSKEKPKTIAELDSVFGLRSAVKIMTRGGEVKLHAAKMVVDWTHVDLQLAKNYVDFVMENNN